MQPALLYISHVGIKAGFQIDFFGTKFSNYLMKVIDLSILLKTLSLLTNSTS